MERQDSKYDVPIDAALNAGYLTRLRNREREYLTLRWRGHSWGEIAIKMGITRRTIWDYARATYALWQHYAEEETVRNGD